MPTASAEDATRDLRTFAPIVSPLWLSILALMSLSIGVVIRAPIVFGADFPLNDGGLFVAFIEDVMKEDFAFLHHVDWNGHRIPFAYPPLSFYAAAALSSVSGIEPLEIVQYGPFWLNLIALPLFVLLASRLAPTRSSLFFACVAFPIVPRSYEWLIMGGGVSRSPAMVAMLVALLLTMEAVDRRRPILLVATTGVLGIVLLLHLEWAISAWVGTSLLLAMTESPRKAIAQSVAVGLGMGLVTLPWWASVVAIHGIDPYVAAMTTGGWGSETLWTRFTTFDLFTLPGSWFAVTAAVGFALAWTSGRREQILIVAWLLLIFLTTPRHAKTVAAIPTAILVGIALAKATTSILGGLRRSIEQASNAPSSPPFRQIVVLVHMIVAASLFGYMLWEVENRPVNEQSPLFALTPGERAGMEWISENVDGSARFLVASTSYGWAWDRAAEWFPLLADHRSVNTLQGLEWVRGSSFDGELIRSESHRQAAYLSPSIAPKLGLQLFGPSHDHVAVFAPKGTPIRLSYAGSEIYELVREEDEMAVYRMRDEIYGSLSLQSGASLVR